MTGKASRDKGARGERQAAKVLSEQTGYPVVRSARNGVDGASDLMGLPGWTVEVKNGYPSQPLSQWWEKVCSAASLDQARPLLIYKQDRSPWRVRVPASWVTAKSHSDAETNREFWVEMTPITFGAIIKGNA